jgi:hypothetical protein
LAAWLAKWLGKYPKLTGRVERWPWLIPYANNAKLHGEADLDEIAHPFRKSRSMTPGPADDDGVPISRPHASAPQQSFG